MSTTCEEITQITRESYDAVPYPGGAHSKTHPCHLAMIARLCGLTPPPPRHCRVLELGCSMGGNLFPMAQDLPESQFVGIDLSERQIEHGQSILAELGIHNLELKQLGITEVDRRLGKFDYIICHGVYSWVPPDVQRAILELGRTHLTSNGILLVSYNTYPGWHFRGVVREMMRYHVAEFDTPQEQIQQARGLLDFIAKYAQSRSQAYPTLLEEEVEMLQERLDSYIFHEHLEEVNEAVYFHEFVRRADAAGMRYLADSSFGSMIAQKFDESAAEILKGAPLLRREQYMDFLRSRMFRTSLLCHPDLVPDYASPAKHLAPLYVALKRPFTNESETPDGVVWEHPDGKLTTQAPVTEAIEKLQHQCPSWTAVQELLDVVPPEYDRAALLDSLLMSFINGLLHVAADPVRIGAEVVEKPACTRYCRLQAGTGRTVTNHLHRNVTVQAHQRFLLQHLDGTHTADDLSRMLQAEVSAGRMNVSRDGQPVQPSAGQSLEIVKLELEQLRRLAMFTG